MGFSFVLQLLFFWFGISQGAVFTPEFEAELRLFINSSMDCRRIPGMTLTVVKGGEVWSNGFGTADFSSQRNVDANTLFNIGSVTKSFTATLLGMLLKENGLNWSTKVTNVLGQGYEFVDDYRTQELTMKDLLSHRTGLATLDEGLLSGYPQSLSRQALCKKLKYLPAKRPIRDVWVYNNYMYMLLGHVAEVLGKDTWENLVTARILEPLKMNNTRILKNPSDVLEFDVARPYVYRDGYFQNGTLEIYDIHPNEPAGAILSSGTDMAKWIQFNLKLGKTEAGAQLLDRKLMEEMHWATTGFANQNVMKERFLTKPQYPVDEIQIGYGYGWFLSTYRGYKLVWHSGGLFSYITLFWILPDKDIGIYASVNGPAFKRLPGRHLTTLFYYISDHLLGLKPWLNETTACTFPEPWANNSARESKEPEVPITVSNRTEFSGSFSNPLLPTVVVSTNSTPTSFRSNRIRGNLHPSSVKDRLLLEITHPWEFAVAYTDDNNQTQLVNVTFIRDNKGVVSGFKAGFEVEITYVRDGMTLDGASGCLRLSISMIYLLSVMLFMTILE